MFDWLLLPNRTFTRYVVRECRPRTPPKMNQCKWKTQRMSIRFDSFFADDLFCVANKTSIAIHFVLVAYKSKHIYWLALPYCTSCTGTDKERFAQTYFNDLNPTCVLAVEVRLHS